MVVCHPLFEAEFWGIALIEIAHVFQYILQHRYRNSWNKNKYLLTKERSRNMYNKMIISFSLLVYIAIFIKCIHLSQYCHQDLNRNISTVSQFLHLHFVQGVWAFWRQPWHSIEHNSNMTWSFCGWSKRGIWIWLKWTFIIHVYVSDDTPLLDLFVRTPQVSTNWTVLLSSRAPDPQCFWRTQTSQQSHEVPIL